MTMDPRLLAIEDDEDNPHETARDQMVVIFDNMMAGYWADPRQTDAKLRRDGHIKTADRLSEIFGQGWWLNH